jgi:acetate kinase
MGLTPLEGLVMGTRSGDLDPAIIEFVAAKEGLSAQEVETLLNKQSGLLGISGLTNDMRELLDEARESNDRRAARHRNLCYRARKYIGSYLAAMNGADAIVFTGGIGENSRKCAPESVTVRLVRTRIDSARNNMMTGGHEGVISTDNSRLAAYVIPTNEELLIARDTVRVVSGVPQRF